MALLLEYGIFNNTILNEEEANHISQFITNGMADIDYDASNSIGNFIKQDFLDLIVMAVLSCSFIGIPILIILLFIKAVSLGITVSAMIHASGIGCGMSFSILVFMVPVIIKIFVMLLIVCSSIKFFENLFQYKKEIRYEFVRHAFIIFLSFLVICILTLYRAFSLNLINQILF